MASLIFGNTTVPETTTGLSYAILSVTYATTYTWTVPTGWSITSGQGSTGNVIAALASFFIPGLGQLIQGRLLVAIIHFVLAGILWFFLLGWIVHLWSIIDAARYK